MWKQIILGTITLITLTTSAALANPKQAIVQSYKYDRRAVNETFDRQDDALRAQQRALLDREKAAWQHARRHVAPAERKYVDQQYHAQRQALNHEFDARRNALNHWYDDTRDALHDDFRYSLRASQGYVPPPVHYHPVPDCGHQSGYTPHYGPAVSPYGVGYGQRPAPARDIVFGILDAVLN